MHKGVFGNCIKLPESAYINVKTLTGDTIMDNLYGFDMGLEEVCDLLNEYVRIICSHNPDF